MKLILFIILTFLNVQSVSASEVLAPFLEGASSYVDANSYKKSQKFFKTDAKHIGPGAEKIIEAGLESDLDSIVDSLALAFSDRRRDERNIVEHVLVICRQENRIDDILYRLLLETAKAKFPSEEEIENPGPAMSLSDYLKKKMALKKVSTASTVDVPSVNPFPKKKFSFKVGKYQDLSAQEMILYTYNINQIRNMAKIMSRTLNVIDAESVITTVTFRDNSEAPLILVHSASDQYRLAVRLMKMEKKAAEQDSFRIGRHVNNIDLIISAYMMGVLSHDELSLIVHDDNFYRPEVSMEIKVLKFVGQLALLGLKLHPVTAPYVIIPILLYNTYAETKKQAKRVDEDSFLFTLPGERQ